MSISVYLDWCPTPTHSINPQVFGDAGSEKQLQEISDFAAKKLVSPDLFFTTVKSICFAYRTDGIFIFAVNWRDAPGSTQTEFNIASIVSHYVKTKLGHIHNHNSDHSAVIRSAKWHPLHKYPIHIDLKNDLEDCDVGELEVLIANDDSIIDLMSDYHPLLPVKQNAEEREKQGQSLCAILRLRTKYARAYDRTMQWIYATKMYQIGGVYVYRRYFLFVITYLLFVFGWTIHSLADRSENAATQYDIFFAGFVNAASVFVFLGFLRVVFFWALLPVGRWISDKKTLHLKATSSMGITSITNVIGKIIPREADIVFLLLFSGPFIFSIQEMPNFIGLLKMFKVSITSEWLISIEKNLNIVSYSSALEKGGFILSYIKGVFFYAPIVVMIFYVVDVSIKRRKVLQALSNLKGTLVNGNIYNAVVDAIYCRVGAKEVRRFGFNDAIKLIDDKITLERRKRTQVQAHLFIVMIISILICYPEYTDTIDKVYDYYSEKFPRYF